MRDPREKQLNDLADRKSQIMAESYSAEASREIEAIDAAIEAIWADVEREIFPWR